MGELKLVSPSEKYRIQYIHFIEECKEDIQECAMCYYMPFSDSNSFSEDLRIEFARRLGSSKHLLAYG